MKEPEGYPYSPHGPGFRFLDSIEMKEPGKRLVARKWLDPELPFFADHFPGEPIMPGVLLIEAAAQASGGVWKSFHQQSENLRYVLAQVEGFRLKRVVLPGQTIEIEVTLDRDFGSLAKFEAIIREGEEVVALGKITLSRNLGSV